jgi:uncharacterized phage protein gp47/JayE
MPFERPALPALIARAESDAAARLTDGAPLLPVSNLAVLSRVLAGAVHGLYGYLDWLSRQVMPDLAELEHLERHAALWGISRLPATYATGNLTLSGTLGTTLPAGTRWRRADGALVVLDDAVTLGSGSTAATVTALAPGAAANTAAGVGMTLVSPLSGVGASAAVASGGLTGGAESEGDEALRARLLLRLREPPHGGAGYDYVAWALAAHPLVTRAWVYPEELGPGSVTVRVMTDDASVDGIPEPAVVAAVQAYIDARRPVTAAVTVVAPVAVALDVTLAVVPDTTAVRAAVEAALADLVRRVCEPGSTLPLTWLCEAIATTPGETGHALTAPSADVTRATGQITTLGAVTFV